MFAPRGALERVPQAGLHRWKPLGLDSSTRPTTERDLADPISVGVDEFRLENRLEVARDGE